MNSDCKQKCKNLGEENYSKKEQEEMMMNYVFKCIKNKNTNACIQELVNSNPKLKKDMEIKKCFFEKCGSNKKKKNKKSKKNRLK